MQLKEKIIVITGASKGLGEALAVGLMKEGSKVIISARKKRELNVVAAKIGALAYPADVTKEKDVIKLADLPNSDLVELMFGLITLASLSRTLLLTRLTQKPLTRPLK